MRARVAPMAHIRHRRVLSNSSFSASAPEPRMKRLAAYSTVTSMPSITAKRRPASSFSQSQLRLGEGVRRGFRKSLSSFE